MFPETEVPSEPIDAADAGRDGSKVDRAIVLCVCAFLGLLANDGGAFVEVTLIPACLDESGKASFRANELGSFEDELAPTKDLFSASKEWALAALRRPEFPTAFNVDVGGTEVSIVQASWFAPIFLPFNAARGIDRADSLVSCRRAVGAASRTREPVSEAAGVIDSGLASGVVDPAGA